MKHAGRVRWPMVALLLFVDGLVVAEWLHKRVRIIFKDEGQPND